MAILIPVEDRVSTYPGRVTMTPVPGQANVYDMSRADEPVQEGTPLNKALLDQKAYTLTEDIVIHVSPSGNDAEGDGSSITPFATIQAALDALPRILGGYTATIDVAEGTYNERISVTGFSGGNLIIGQPGRNVVVRGIAVRGSSHVTFNIPNITWASGFSGALFLVTHDGAVALNSNMTINCAGSTEVGIDVAYGSELVCAESTVTVQNCARNAIRITNGSKAAFYDIAGDNNSDLGLVAENGGVLSYNTLNLSSTHGNVAQTGGRIQGGSGSDMGTYIHRGDELIGYGENGKFKATVSETITAIGVNGVRCSVRCGEDSSMDLIAGCWYTFILDGDTVNFNQGGAGSSGSELVIVSGITRPAKATPNMIWLNTDEEITEYVFSAVEPEQPVEGMAWIAIGTTGGIKIASPVGGNYITVYPLKALVYVSGEWIGVPSCCYQDGEWRMWFSGALFDGVLFDGGSVNEDVTGGWSASDGATVSNTLFGDYYSYPSTRGATCSTVNKVDLTEYSTLKVNCTNITGTAFLSVSTGSSYAAEMVFTTTGVIELNISTVSGEHYISIASSGVSDGDYTVDRVWLE